MRISYAFLRQRCAFLGRVRKSTLPAEMLLLLVLLVSPRFNGNWSRVILSEGIAEVEGSRSTKSELPPQNRLTKRFAWDTISIYRRQRVRESAQYPVEVTS